MNEKECEKCKMNNDIEEHHIHPKFMDNKNGDGIKIKFTKKDHIILHLKIPSILWKYIKTEDKLTVIQEVKDFAFKHSGDKIPKKLCPMCTHELDPEDFIDGTCNHCLSPLKNKEDEEWIS